MTNSQRALETIHSRYMISLRDIQDKDEFIAKRILDKNAREDINNYLEEYRAILSRQSCWEVFREEQEELQRLRGSGKGE